MPFISVIIPTYNRKELVGRAIDSVLKQSYRDFELIVVDDASEDGTGELPCFSGDHEIRYVQLPLHRGVAAARNIGVSMSAGEWLCFLDSDDEWHRDKLKKQVAWHEAHREFRIFQTQEIWIRGGVRVNAPKTHAKIHGHQFKENLERCMITPSSVMMEKRLFLESGGFNETLPACEDYDLWLRIASVYPVGLLQEPLLTRFGGRSDQLSSMVPVLDRFRVRGILDILKTGRLSQEQRDAARKQVVKKARILANGYHKRGKKDEYEFYQQLAREYGSEEIPSSRPAAGFL
jgi:glycosyltransferase involved in cell wall biosynthesis